MTALSFVSSLAIPAILIICAALLLSSKKDLFGAFLDGAKDGLHTTVSLIPTLVVLMAAVSMFSASGAPELLAKWLAPIGDKIGFPSELLPLLIVRPISGSASLALADSVLTKYGPDSITGLICSVIMGSSDTVVYILAVYFGAVGVKTTRHALAAALITMFFSITLACLVTRLLL